jgi:hypothetical protein
MSIPIGCRDYFIIAAVRNPYVRELSRYIWAKRHPWENPDTFGEWGQLDLSSYLQKLRYRHSLCGSLQYGLMNLRSKKIQPARRPRIDIVIHQEFLHEDLLRVPFIRETDIKEDVLIPTLNRTPDSLLDQYRYSYKDANLLYEIFEDDFVRFDYNSRPPKELCQQMFI